jgi:hypothetical protein
MRHTKEILYQLQETQTNVAKNYINQSYTRGSVIFHKHIYFAAPQEFSLFYNNLAASLCAKQMLNAQDSGTKLRFIGLLIDAQGRIA